MKWVPDREQSELRNEASCALSQYFPAASVTVASVKESYNNIIIRFRVAQRLCIAKVYRESGSVYRATTRLEREWFGLTEAFGAGVCPEPLLVERLPTLWECPFLVYEYVPGHSMRTRDITNATARRIGEGLRRLHNSDGGLRTPASKSVFVGLRNLEEFDAYVDKFRHGVRAGVAFIDASLQDVVNALPTYHRNYQRACQKIMSILSTPHSSLTHGDLGIHNIISQPNGKVRFVDWEYAGFRDPAYEVASLFWFPVTDYERLRRLRKSVLDSYCEDLAAGERARLNERVDAYDVISGYKWLLRAMRYYASEHTHQMSRQKKIKELRTFILNEYRRASEAMGDL